MFSISSHFTGAVKTVMLIFVGLSKAFQVKDMVESRVREEAERFHLHRLRAIALPENLTFQISHMALRRSKAGYHVPESCREECRLNYYIRAPVPFFVLQFIGGITKDQMENVKCPL